MAIGPQKGRKVFTLQTIPPQPEESPDNSRVAKSNGFSLHASVAAQTHQRRKVERLCRYIARPAVSEQRLSLTPTGKVRYEAAIYYQHRELSGDLYYSESGFSYRLYFGNRHVLTGLRQDCDQIHIVLNPRRPIGCPQKNW